MIENVATRSVTNRILCPICRSSNRPDARFCQQCGNDVLLDNIYRITRVIKEGGMGVVYQAIDADGEVYAVKEMHDRFTNDKDREEGIERFIDEAKLLRTLRGHPNIPQVYRSFIDEGRYYLSMEFIFGEDLEDILKRQKRFPEPQVLRWADELCDVLEFMHAHGLIYRDMKPSNIMITQDGSLKVVDFGIAKLLQPGQRATMVGTPGYAPPEQYQGITTPESDVYALAATLHHLLTGRDPRDEPPFSFPPAKQIQPDISAQTSQVLEKALQMELSERYPNVGQFRAALPIPGGERQAARPFEIGPPSGRTSRVDRAPQPAPRPQPVPQRPAPLPPTAPPMQRTAPQQPRQVQPQPQPVPKQRKRRGGFGRAVRRLVATAALATGAYYGAATYAPEQLEAVQTYVTTFIQENLPPDGESQGTTPAQEELAPAGFTRQRVEVPVEILVTEGTSQELIDQEWRAKFLAAAQQQFPGATLAETEQLQTVGNVEEVPASPGFKGFRATIQSFVQIPDS